MYRRDMRVIVGVLGSRRVFICVQAGGSWAVGREVVKSSTQKMGVGGKKSIANGTRLSIFMHQPHGSTKIESLAPIYIQPAAVRQELDYYRRSRISSTFRSKEFLTMQCKDSGRRPSVCSCAFT